MNNKEMLCAAATAYYNGHPIIMSDEDYDKLLLEVSKEYHDFNIFNNIIIGDDRASVPHHQKYINHKFKIAFSKLEELLDIISKISNNEHNTYKLDGCSITAYYSNGILFDIITRSDDTYGKRKFDQLKNKVPKIVDPCVIKIDFEGCCSIDDLGDGARAKANGLINSCYMQDEVDRLIQLIPFKVTCDPTVTTDYIKSFLYAGYNQTDIPLVLVAPTDYLDRSMSYKGKKYPIDGFVVYSDTISPHKIYKHYANEQIITEITSVDWRLSDYLCWVPRLIYNTIKVDGRNCSSATSKGLGMLRTKQCGVGAKITVFLANSTIPMVDKVIEPSTNYQILKACPFCGTEVEEVNAKLMCKNPECPRVFHEYAWRILHFLNIISSKYGVLDLNNRDKLREFKNNNFDKSNLYSLPNAISKSLLIERFSAHKQIETQLQENIDNILTGKSIVEFIKYGLTGNQHAVFIRHAKTIDKIIEILKE